MTHPVDVSELTDRFLASRGGLPAIRDQVLSPHIDVERQLLVDVQPDPAPSAGKPEDPPELPTVTHATSGSLESTFVTASTYRSHDDVSAASASRPRVVS